MLPVELVAYLVLVVVEVVVAVVVLVNVLVVDVDVVLVVVSTTATIAAENRDVLPMSLVAVAVIKAKMMEVAKGVGLTRRMALPRLTASILLLKLARLPHCLCW